MAKVDETTLHRLGKIARDYRSMLARDYVFGKKKHMHPSLVYTDILPESWEFFKEHAQAYFDDVSTTFIYPFYSLTNLLLHAIDCG
jgi:hypothetical protein